MKVQDMMLHAMAKKIIWWQGEILGISDRHMRRWRERYVEEGLQRQLRTIVVGERLTIERLTS